MLVTSLNTVFSNYLLKIKNGNRKSPVKTCVYASEQSFALRHVHVLPCWENREDDFGWDPLDAIEAELEKDCKLHGWNVTWNNDEQRQILESREVLQLSCGTNNLKKQKSEVSSRLIDRMLSRSGFSAPNSTLLSWRSWQKVWRPSQGQCWWIFFMNMSHPVIHMNHEMVWLQGRSIVSPGDRNHGRTTRRVKRVKTRKMRLGMLWKSAKSQRNR